MPARDPFPNPAGTSPQASGHSDDPGPYRDLCSNCDHAVGCVCRSTARRPIFFCEEFMVLGAVAVLEAARDVAGEPRQARNVHGHIGLCVNCECLDTCTLPRPEGGIWHCEEYR